jgi:uncharacterized membrane protein YedE/YeeE
MTAPLLLNEVISADCSLWLAVLIGIGMGFFLERAGFGSAKKLAAQFYLYDMAVFKVMGTAVVTAMVGIFLFSSTGYLDLDKVSMVGTFIWPQVIGGLILGVGFVVGGYCPGTSVVACATGKLDGMVFAGGLVAGMFIYGGLYPSIQCFVDSSPLGRQTLYGFFNIPYGVVVLIVIVVATVAFRGATILENRFARLKPLDQPPE